MNQILGSETNVLNSNNASPHLNHFLRLIRLGLRKKILFLAIEKRRNTLTKSIFFLRLILAVIFI